MCGITFSGCLQLAQSGSEILSLFKFRKAKVYDLRNVAIGGHAQVLESWGPHDMEIAQPAYCQDAVDKHTPGDAGINSI